MQVGAAAVLTTVVCGSFLLERYQPVAVVLALLAFAVLIRTGDWWARQRVVVITIAIDITLIFLYLWSLDEWVHIVIRVDASGYTATMEGQTAVWHIRPTAGIIGFTAGPMTSYRTGITVHGISSHPSVWHGTSLAGQFLQWTRFAAPGPAWTNVSITIPGQPPLSVPLASHGDVPLGSWTVNRRGELEGALGTSTRLPFNPGTKFKLQADLVRPDAAQGILLGVTASRTAQAFTVNFDDPSAGWSQWSSGKRTTAGPGSGAWLDTVGLIRHNLRLALANAVVALLLVLAALPAYFVLGLIGRISRPPGTLPAWINVLTRPRMLDAAAVAIALSTIVVAALVADRLFERVPHDIDSVTYLFQAKMLAAGRLWLAVPQHRQFFPFPFMVIHGDKWFPKYSPGWPLTLAAGVALGIPWLVNPLLTGANALLIYLIGREIYGRMVGLTAAALALSSPYLLALGAEYMSHTAVVFYLCLSTHFFVYWHRRIADGTLSEHSGWRLLVPAGFFLGMAAITRSLDTVAFSWPFLLALPWRSLFRWARAVGWIGLGAAAPIAFNMTYNAVLTGSPLTSPFMLSDRNDHLGFGVPKGMVGHYTFVEGLWNTVARMESLLAGLFGWPFFFTLAMAAIPFVLGRAAKWDAVLGACGLSVMLTYILYFFEGQIYDPRYWAAAAPPLILLTSRGFQELYRLGRWFPVGLRPRPLAALTVPVALAVLLLACDVFSYMPAQLPAYRGYYYSSATFLDPIQRAHLHNALVFVVPLGTSSFVLGPKSSPFALWLPLLQNSPGLRGDVVFAKDLGSRDRKLILQYPHRTYFLLKHSVLQRMTVKT